MKLSEIIELNYDRISDAMYDAYEEVIKSDGAVQVDIYIWSDGEIETLHEAQGSNSFLVAKDWESRTLYYITTVASPFFDWRNYAEESVPDKDEEPIVYELMKKEVIDYLLENSEHETELELVLERAKQEEKYEEEWS